MMNHSADNLIDVDKVGVDGIGKRKNKLSVQV